MAIRECTQGSPQDFTMYSMYDEKKIKTEPYLQSAVFKGFSGRKMWFNIKGLQQGIKSGIVVLSDIKLLVTGYLIKLFSPKTKVLLIAHDMEAWKPLSARKKRMLKRIDLIIPVSDFTKGKM